MQEVSVVVVCLANICRSPAAEGILLSLAETEKEIDLHVESRGLGDWHVGRLPEERMRLAAEARGYSLTTRAQLFTEEDFEAFDFILAVDHDVLNQLYHVAPSLQDRAKVHLITSFSESYPEEDVPDPYYGGQGAFEAVLDVLEDSCKGFLRFLYHFR